LLRAAALIAAITAVARVAGFVVPSCERAYLAERGRARAADWPTPDDTVTQVAAVYQGVTGVAG
jgi:hypothetical protein